MFKHLEALTTNSLIMCQTKKAKTLREDRTLSVRHEEPTGPDEAEPVEEEKSSLEIWRRYMNSTYPMSGAVSSSGRHI